MSIIAKTLLRATDNAIAIINTVRTTTTDVSTFISAVKNKELPDMGFFTAYSTHLKNTVLQLNNNEFNTFLPRSINYNTYSNILNIYSNILIVCSKNLETF